MDQLQVLSNCLLVLTAVYILLASCEQPRILQASANSDELSLAKSTAEPSQPARGALDQEGPGTELDAQRFARALLGGAALEGLGARLPPGLDGEPVRECVQFNSSMDKARDQLDKLIGLATSGFSGLLNQRLWAARRVARQRDAYEALNSTVWLYFQCVARMGQLGSIEGLTCLLPCSIEMGALSELVAGGTRDGKLRKKRDYLVLNEEFRQQQQQQQQQQQLEPPSRAGFLAPLLGAQAYRAYERALNWIPSLFSLSATNSQ